MAITKTEIAAIVASISTVAAAVAGGLVNDNADWLAVLVPAVIASGTKIAAAFQSQAAIKAAASGAKTG